jgi:hypothetical protein
MNKLSSRTPEKSGLTIDLGPLTAAEKRRFQTLETRIREAVKTMSHAYRQIGKALDEIKTKKLYREKHASFEDYCKSGWGVTRDMGYKLIDAYKFTKKLLEDGMPPEHLPHTERLVRELTKMNPSDAKKVLARAHQNRIKSGRQTLVLADMRLEYAKTAVAETSPSIREKQIRELTHRFTRIVDDMRHVDIGWGDLPAESATKIRAALTEIALLASTHLRGMPKEFGGGEGV